MADLNATITTKLRELGADMVGFGDLSELSSDIRGGLPIGISIGVRLPIDIVRGIIEAPTLPYWDYYNSGQEDLDKLSDMGAEYVRSLGYNAVALSRKEGVKFVSSLRSELPYKTVATRSGLGWIGKCAMLVTEQYGTGVWFSAILTDAPLNCAEPINESRCGACNVCRDACPASAISGDLWTSQIDRDTFFNAGKCASFTKVRAKELLRVNWPLCGKCIAVCPKTKRYLDTAI